MKNMFMLMAGFVFILNVHATEEKKYVHPSETEIEQNRSCFQDLEVQGCGKWEDDPVQFRSCMSNAQESLDDHCKKLMLKLYGTK